jgi:hypothetical protein
MVCRIGGDGDCRRRCGGDVRNTGTVVTIVGGDRDNERVGDKYFNLIKRKGRAPRSKLSEVGKKGIGSQGRSECWRTSQAFQLSHIVRRAHTWSVDHEDQQSTPF